MTIPSPFHENVAPNINIRLAPSLKLSFDGDQRAYACDEARGEMRVTSNLTITAPRSRRHATATAPRSRRHATATAPRLTRGVGPGNVSESDQLATLFGDYVFVTKYEKFKVTLP